MRVRQLTAYVLRVQLRKPFRHASAVRNYSDNILIRAELADGTTGWGEGVPRDYVTGETAEGAIEQLLVTPVSEQFAAGASNWTEAIQLCERFEPAAVVEDPRGSYGNSLRAAVELSLIDAYGKLFGEPVSKGLEAYPGVAETLLAPSAMVRYSTTIDAESKRKLWRSSLKMRAYGFRQCKVKVGADCEADAARMGVIRRWIGPRMDLRVDANEAWKPEHVLKHATALAPFGITCIEQPVAHEELESLSELRRELNIPVMLDESLTSLYDAREAIRLRACDLFNIRISKCGGLLNSLRLAMLSREHGLGYQLGCHPGETGILSAAGRHFASAVRDIRYLEGSYDHHVLATVPTTPDLTFGYGGRAPALTQPGLGVVLDLKVARGSLRDERVITVDQ
jgi:L-alanine-DL-glutamate epimerase-like enolase superfamily enzyme